MNIKSWIYTFFLAGMWLGGACMMSAISGLPPGHVKNILFGIGLVAACLGAKYFLKRIWK